MHHCLRGDGRPCAAEVEVNEIEMNFAKIGLFMCLYPEFFLKTVFARGPPGRCSRPTGPTG